METFSRGLEGILRNRRLRRSFWGFRGVLHPILRLQPLAGSGWSLLFFVCEKDQVASKASCNGLRLHEWEHQGCVFYKITNHPGGGGGVIIFEDLGIPYLANNPNIWENKKVQKRGKWIFWKILPWSYMLYINQCLSTTQHPHSFTLYITLFSFLIKPAHNPNCCIMDIQPPHSDSH